MVLKVNSHTTTIITELVNEKEYNLTDFEFIFSEEYTDDLVKKAIFTLNNQSYKVPISINKCSIPSEVLEERGIVEVGVTAYKIVNDEYEKVFNPRPSFFSTMAGSIKNKYENSSTPTPTEIEQIESELANKVDKITGKDLSTNDYTTEEKIKLASLKNYDDTDVKNDISSLQTNKADKSEILDELADLQDDSTHRLVTDAEKTVWSGKQDALTAGDNITISNNVISATGGSSEPYVWDGTDTPEARQKFLDIINNYTDNGIVDYNAIVLSDSEDVYHMTSFSATKTPIMTGGKFTFTYYYTNSASSNPLIYSKFVGYANLFGNISFDISNKIQNKLLLPYNNSTSGTQKVLTTDNQQSFTPSSNYHPATKKYVDDSIPDISGKLDTSKVKSTSSTTSGDVYDVTYINSVLGDISTALSTLVTVGGGS